MAWAAVVRGMNDPVVVIDPSGRIVELNEVAQRLAGRPLRRDPRIRGRHGLFTLARAGRAADAAARARRAQLRADRAGCRNVLGVRRQDFVVWEVQGAILGWVLVLRDITEHKRAAEERVRMLSEQSARAEAEAANRAKDRFLATLSHELRTPLTPVLAAVTAMLGDATTPESLRTVLEMIRRNISLEARLIDDLLDLARIGRGALHLKREIDRCPRNDQSCDRNLRRRFSPGGARASPRPGAAQPSPRRRPDPVSAGAVEPDQERDQVHPRRRASDGAHARIANTARATEPPAALLVEISDTGIGIEPDAMQRIFDGAEHGGTAATRRFGGLGLGLSLSRSIVEAARRNALGRQRRRRDRAPPSPSSCRACRLALGCRGSSLNRPRTTSACRRRSSIARRLRILLVDDNADTLKFLSTMLRRRGHDVATASDMASALQLASETEHDLLISDIELPDGNGRELMETIRATEADSRESHSRALARRTTSSRASRPALPFISPSPSISAGSSRSSSRSPPTPAAENLVSG